MNDTTVTVVGTVCSEVRYSQPNDETPIARFQIRTTPRRYDKRTGTWSDGDPSYYSATCFRALADHVASSMGVGDPVVATGRLRINRWRRGEEHVVTAELDVQAIGHDLRWGTSVYRRSAAPTRIPGPGRHRNPSIPTASTTAAADTDAERSEAETDTLVPAAAATGFSAAVADTATPAPARAPAAAAAVPAPASPIPATARASSVSDRDHAASASAAIAPTASAAKSTLAVSPTSAAMPAAAPDAATTRLRHAAAMSTSASPAPRAANAQAKPAANKPSPLRPTDPEAVELPLAA